MSRIFGSSLEDLEKSMKARSIDISRISFTRDNFMKLAFIYLRLRVGQSVIIMGETGVGKTAIINYLADVLNYEFRVLNLHEGVTEDDILEFVSSARSFASSNRERKVLLFFDEINTNMHIDGLLKEIVIDRRVRGD
jgi:MoxR-like ATPase